MSRLLSALVLGALVGLVVAGYCTRTVPSASGPAVDAAWQAVRAADAFLKTLDATQRLQMVNPAGIQLNDLEPSQRQSAEDLLQAVLDEQGMLTVQGVMAADERFDREVAPGRSVRSRAYRLAILGTPSLAGRWQVQLSGQYFGVQITIAGGARVLSPTCLHGRVPRLFRVDL
jgi:hypothetical protein